MKKLIGLAFLASSFGSLAVAADDPFSGFSVGIAAKSQTFEGATTSYVSRGQNLIASGALSLDKYDESKTLTEVILKYSLPVSNGFYLGAAYEKTFGDSGAKPMLGTLNGSRILAADSVTVKNIKSFVLTPGYKLSPNSLISLRIGQMTSKTEIASVGEPLDTVKNKNMITGIGFDYAMSNNLILNTSYDVYKSDDGSFSNINSAGAAYSGTFSTKGHALKFGISYKF